MRLINMLAVLVVLAMQGVGVRASAPTRGILEGFVVDGSNGRALAGVLIAVRSGSKVIQRTTTRTDQKGHFAIEVESAAIAMAFSLRGHVRVGHALSSVPRLPLRIALAHAKPVRGTLVDGSGAPVRARVTLVPTERGGLQQVLEAFTRPDGTYVIDGAGNAKNYRMQVERRGCPRRTLRLLTGDNIGIEDFVDTVNPC